MAEEKLINKISGIKKGIKGVSGFSEKNENIFSSKDFYKDLDRIRNKSCCTFPSIVISLLLIFAFVIYGLFTIKNLTKSGLSFIVQNKKIAQSSLNQSFFDRTNLMLPGETKTLDFNETEVANYLGVADSDFPIKKARLQIDGSGMILTGRTGESVISLPIKAVVKPKVDQNKITFYIDSIGSGPIPLPGSIKNKFNVYIDNIMKSRSFYDENLEILNAVTLPQILQIDIHKKI